MKLIKGIGITLLLGLTLSCQPEEKLPNIVYIICDDLGYGDVQVLNPDRGKIATPNIDKLASEGMTFTDAHSASSVCTPTRYALLTGRYAWRTSLQKGVLGGGKVHEPLIAEDRLTVPALLKKSGYNTACIGKWHLGFQFVDENDNEINISRDGKSYGVPMGTKVLNGPITRGFDTYFGFHHSAKMETVINDDKVIDEMPVIRMLETLGDKACNYIVEKSQNSDPFFLYLALNSPHSPVVPSEKWQGKSGLGSYGDFVMETDHIVGRVLNTLIDYGIEKNTLVFVTSDNGCSYPAAKGEELESEYGHFPSAQYRGSKSDIWEGGHRIPFFAKWPAEIIPNTINNELISLNNLMATCADITDSEIPVNAGEDSFSILPLLMEQTNSYNQDAVVHHSINGKFSIRKGKWKLEFCPGSGGWTNPKDGKAREQGLPEIQLYDLEKDPEEKNNVYEEHLDLVEKLKTELEGIVTNGRSTPGTPQKNDVLVDIYKEEI